MPFEIAYPRILPERRPPNHQPAAPRYTLRWNHPAHTLISDYFAIQRRNLSWAEEHAFIERAKAAFDHPNGPDAFEHLRSSDPAGHINGITVAYWTDATKHARWSLSSSLVAWFKSRDRLAEGAGYWRESLVVPFDRAETIYSAPHYKIGLARCAGGEIGKMTTNGYFGAARDRIPLSAIDKLESPSGSTAPSANPPQSLGKRLYALAPLNTTVLRSGQYWANAGVEQDEDYHQNLQPKLNRGMNYLVDHQQATGCFSMRMMSNIDAAGNALNETSVLAYFHSLENLESWAAGHETHLDIYRHAIAMNRKYGDKREVVTWHELFVLPLSSTLEYANCHGQTGLLPFFEFSERA